MARSIRTRLLISFIILAVGPLLLLGFVVALITFNVLQRQAIASQQQEASGVAVQVSSLLTDSIQRMEMLIQGDGLGIVGHPQQKTLLDELANYDHAINELSVLDVNGQEQARIARREVLSGTDLRDQSQLDEFKIPAQTKKIYFSSVAIDQATSEPLMTVAIPMFDLRSGAFSGVFVGAIRFRPIWDLIANLSATRNDTIYIVDSTGRVVAHRDPTVVLKSTNFKIPADTGPVIGLSGSSVIFASSDFQFGAQVFSVVTEKPVAEAFALAINEEFIILAIILISLLGALASGVFTVQRLVRPIVLLSTTAEAISGGDLTRRVNVKSKDEIGRLGKAFDSMTAQLVQTLDGLRHNVSDLEQANRERERLIVELREASRLKNEFLSTMSHELRTPLNAMLGFTGLLLAGISGVIDQDAQHMVERIEANSKRLLKIINDILDISKIEAGRMELIEAPVSLGQLADQWHTQLGILANEKGLAFEVSVDTALPEKVLIDREKVTRIAVNLLSNAIKFTEKGTVALLVKRQDNKLILQITDTGIGIPPHALDFIFDEFRQVDGSTSRVYGGTGLGLAIARKLCWIMNGTITVSSVLDYGSTFTVQLPLKLLEALPTPMVQAGIAEP